LAVSRAMRRMLSVLESEEEQRAMELESALGEQRRWEAALGAAQERNRRGRLLVMASASTGEVVDRIAGVEEIRSARQKAAKIAPRIAETEQKVAMRRQEFLAKRIERRQAETLIERSEARDAVDAARRTQRELDDWFLSRGIRDKQGGSGTLKSEMEVKDESGQ
jgi:hypothetical protein